MWVIYCFVSWHEWHYIVCRSFSLDSILANFFIPSFTFIIVVLFDSCRTNTNSSMEYLTASLYQLSERCCVEWESMVRTLFDKNVAVETRQLSLLHNWLCMLRAVSPNICSLVHLLQLCTYIHVHSLWNYERQKMNKNEKMNKLSWFWVVNLHVQFVFIDVLHLSGSFSIGIFSKEYWT
jgi:hypothetical protein